MQALSNWPISARQKIIGVFTDIDDTLTTDGAITPPALAAMHALKAAGLYVIAITGRPVGWSEAFALTWPIDAIVAENGAVALHKDPRAAHLALLKTYQQDEPTRLHNFARMQQIAQQLLKEIPCTQMAQDSAGRETDIAIDHNEFTQLSADKVAQVVAFLQAHGMHATISSIHVNAWFGDHHKLAGARWILQTLLHRNLDAEMDKWVYIGDSTNDQLMFAAFNNSFGVANVRQFEAQLAQLPTYITPSERGAGFAEMVALLLAAR